MGSGLMGRLKLHPESRRPRTGRRWHRQLPTRYFLASSHAFLSHAHSPSSPQRRAQWLGYCCTSGCAHLNQPLMTKATSFSPSSTNALPSVSGSRLAARRTRSLRWSGTIYACATTTAASSSRQTRGFKVASIFASSSTFSPAARPSPAASSSAARCPTSSPSNSTPAPLMRRFLARRRFTPGCKITVPISVSRTSMPLVLQMAAKFVFPHSL